MCCVFCLFPHELSSKLLSVCSYDCPKYSLPTEETQLSFAFWSLRSCHEISWDETVLDAVVCHALLRMADDSAGGRGMCLVINEGLKFCFRSFLSNMYNLHIQFKFLDIEKPSKLLPVCLNIFLYCPCRYFFLSFLPCCIQKISYM